MLHYITIHKQSNLTQTYELLNYNSILTWIYQ